MKDLIIRLLILVSLPYLTFAQDTLFVSSNTIELSKAGKRVYKGANILYVKKNLPSNIQFGNASSFYELVAPAGQLKVSINGASAVSGLSYDGIYNVIKDNLSSSAGSGAGSLESTQQAIKLRDDDITYSGTVTSSTPFVIPTKGKGTVSFTVSGTWSGLIDIEASLDGVNWFPRYFSTLPSGVVQPVLYTNNTAGQLNSIAFDYVRFRGESVGAIGGTTLTGTATITAAVSRIAANVMLDTQLPPGTNIIGSVRQGSDWNVTLLAGTNSIGKVVSSLPTSASGSIISLSTNTSGATFNTFASLACTQLRVANNTGTTIEFQIGGTGTAMPIFNGKYYLITGITNASSVGIRRTDLSNTAVTVQAHALTN